jgi:hypothetical protein
MSEIGLDLSEEFPKPISDDIARRVELLLSDLTSARVH